MGAASGELLMLHVHDARLLSAEYDDYDVETSDH
jgi:hypothetical protein